MFRPAANHSGASRRKIRQSVHRRLRVCLGMKARKDHFIFWTMGWETIWLNSRSSGKMAKTPWLIKLVDSFDASICWSPPWWQPSTWPARLEWGNLDLPLVWGRSNIWTKFSIERFERQQVRFLEETPFHLSSLDSCRCAGFLAAGSARSSKTPASRSLLRSSLTWKNR